jgi:hypothetical protein
MLQNRYPKHPLESTHSTHRSQTTDLLPIAMKISDPKETQTSWSLLGPGVEVGLTPSFIDYVSLFLILSLK